MKKTLKIGPRGVFTYFIDGEEVTEEVWREDRGWVDGGPPPQAILESGKCWPMLSESMGVHPKQVKAAQEMSVKIGVPTEFTRDGKAIMRNNAHKIAYAKAMGYPNWDSMYGQVAG
jgi:hypothetical protein